MKTLAKWSVNDYHRMIIAGILRDRRVELLAGDIAGMSPATPIRYTTTKRAAKYLEELLAGRAEVRFNGPITLADSEPEPDISIVRLSEFTYADRHPSAQDIFWLIEVANTSLKTDVEIKAQIYAQAAIQDYWVVVLVNRQVMVFRNPQAGQYTEINAIAQGTMIPLAFNDVSVSVEQLLS